MALASSLTEGTMAGDYKIVKKLAEGENFGPLKHRPKRQRSTYRRN